MNFLLNFYTHLDYEQKLNVLISEMDGVLGDSNIYERIRNGFQVLIFGPPNSGKSSLMNYLGNIIFI